MREVRSESRDGEEEYVITIQPWFPRCEVRRDCLQIQESHELEGHGTRVEHTLHVLMYVHSNGH